MPYPWASASHYPALLHNVSSDSQARQVRDLTTDAISLGERRGQAAPCLIQLSSRSGRLSGGGHRHSTGRRCWHWERSLCGVGNCSRKDFKISPCHLVVKEATGGLGGLSRLAMSAGASGWVFWEGGSGGWASEQLGRSLRAQTARARGSGGQLGAGLVLVVTAYRRSIPCVFRNSVLRG